MDSKTGLPTNKLRFQLHLTFDLEETSEIQDGKRSSTKKVGITPLIPGCLVVCSSADDLCHSLLHPQPDATDVRDSASSWAVPVQRQHLCTKPCKGHWPHRSMWMLLQPRLYPDIQDGPPPCSGCWCSRSRLTKSTVRLLGRHAGAACDSHCFTDTRIHTYSSRNHQ